MDKTILKPVAVFASWTVTSFLCHFCAKLFLRESVNIMPGIYSNVFILTGMQIAFCLLLRPVSDMDDSKARLEKFIILITHACATLATNFSMAVTHAASTFAIKLTEPLSGALFQRLLLGVSLSNIQWISIPITVYGAIVFAEDSHDQAIKISSGTVLAFLSNICLALRNVFIKKKHQSNTDIVANDKLYSTGLGIFSALGVIVLHLLSFVEVVPPRAIYLYGLVLTSSVFHVTYSYISTVTVLKHFSVVSHAFVNIMKRLIVIGLLYMTGSRKASTWNFIGLFICTAGLAMYVWSKLQNKNGGVEYLSKYIGPATKIFVLAVFVVAGAFLLRPYHYNTESLKKTETNIEQITVRGLNESRHLYMSQPASFDTDSFLSTDLVAEPEMANKLSPLLTKRPDVISEAQRIHLNIFRSVLGKFKFAMLFDYDVSEEKGSPAIAVGEVILLHKLNIEIVFSCHAGSCSEEKVDKAYNISQRYPKNQLVVLFHGGGNVLSSETADDRRFLEMERFRDHHIVMFPQGIMYIESESHIKYCKKMYASHKKITFVWRDKKSFNTGKNLFPKGKSLLAPDMAFQIGFVPRYMDPTHDIIWIKRGDPEASKYEAKGFRMDIVDWSKWKTPVGSSPMENIFLLTTNGLTFVQRGRVVITDRLHGHIFSTLLGIPHVFVDSKNHKISDYHNTWTAGLEHVVFANSSPNALTEARKLLAKLDHELPKITGYFLP